MELSALQTSIISLVGVIASLLVGFAVLDEHTAGLVTAAAGTLVAITFQIVTELQRKSKVQAAAALGDKLALQRLSK